MAKQQEGNGCFVVGGLAFAFICAAVWFNLDDETPPAPVPAPATPQAQAPPTTRPGPSTPGTRTAKPSGAVLSSYLRGELPGVRIQSGWDWHGDTAHAVVAYDGDGWDAYVQMSSSGSHLTGYRLKHIHPVDVLLPQYSDSVPRER
jgi:hypothetical protein